MTHSLLLIHSFYFTMLVALFGLCVGSFLNVVVYRLPLMLQKNWRQQCLEFLALKPESVARFNLMFPHSHCPHCKTPISIFENIPLFSFIFLKGRCCHCHKPISIRYPLIELFTALLSASVALQFGPTLQCLFGLIFVWVLIVLVGIDLDHQLLPDEITLPLLWLGLLINTFNIFSNLVSAVFGAASGYLALWSVAMLFKRCTQKEGMGHGDFKLLACFGAWFGWQYLPFIILSSSLLGCIAGITLILFRKRSEAFPFGPYLAFSGLLTLFYASDILKLYD